MPALPAQLLHKSLRLLRLIAADHGQTTLTKIAEQVGIPMSTAHRLVAVLVNEGMLVRTGRGKYICGPMAIALADRQALRGLLKILGTPIIEQLADTSGRIVQLGIFEDDMVTYVVKAGRGSKNLFTREGTALEAYCSGIGKMLLSHLPQDELERYLAAGSFVALTPHTITDPDAIRTEIGLVRQRGYAIDDREIDFGRCCIASAIVHPEGYAVAALSLSVNASDRSSEELESHLPQVVQACRAIEAALFTQWID